jgi:hypothetical protein
LREWQREKKDAQLARNTTIRPKSSFQTDGARGKRRRDGEGDEGGGTIVREREREWVGGRKRRRKNEKKVGERK